jgi:hypothetical protein
MLQVDTQRLIEAAEESVKHEAGEIYEDDLGPTATKDVFGSVTGPISRLTGATGEEGFYSTGTWDAFFEDLHNPDTAADTVAMPELQVAFEI